MYLQHSVAFLDFFVKEQICCTVVGYSLVAIEIGFKFQFQGVQLAFH